MENNISLEGVVSLLSGNCSHGRTCALQYLSSNKYSSSSKIKVDLDSSNGKNLNA